MKAVAIRFVGGGEEFSVPVDGTIILNDVELALRTALSGGPPVFARELRQSGYRGRHASGGPASVEAETIRWVRALLP
jgi:hypothetical protein